MCRIILSAVACLAVRYFSTLSYTRHDFSGDRKVAEHEMCFLILSTTFIRKIFHSENNLARYYHKCEDAAMSSTRYLCMILIKFVFSRQIVEEYSSNKFRENPSSGSRVVSCGRTSGQTDR
jgi:hypothetical protein